MSSDSYRCETCQFSIIGEGIVPSELTTLLHVKPSFAIGPNASRRGWWQLSSKATSMDANDHIRWLLSVLLPHKEQILAAGYNPIRNFITVPAAEQTPYRPGISIDPECLQGIAALGASLRVAERYEFGGDQPDGAANGSQMFGSEIK